MTWIDRNSHPWWLLLAILASTTSLSFHQTVVKKSVLDYPVDETTAVRFCDTNEEDYFHVPLIFRAVKQGDPRLNTAPLVVHEGRTAYISLDEMNRLIQGLAHSSLSWQQSEKVESLKWDLAKGPLSCFGGMEVLVVSSKGTATGKIRTKRICETLKPLDSAIKTPRALWEFQFYRINFGCKPPLGYISGKYADDH
jgi:hypothetical protein